MATTPTPTVQHLTKASSDQLLSKFADSTDDHRSQKSLRLFKRPKRSIQSILPETRRESSEFKLLSERKSLLPHARRSSGANTLVRQLKIGRSNFRARNFKKRSFFISIEKTWQRTVDGASRVFMEKQYYNRHKRLQSDTI